MLSILLEFLYIVLSVSAGVFLGQLLWKFVEKDVTTSDTFMKAQQLAGVAPKTNIGSPSKILKDKQFLESLDLDNE